MNIAPYASDFHDGSIIAIQYQDNDILISMESCEMFEEDLIEPVELSEYNTLKGILHLEKIKKITLNDKPFQGQIPMLGDAGVILDFKIQGKKISMFVRWENFPPKKKTEDCTEIAIECEKIYWENVPDLFDPFE